MSSCGCASIVPAQPSGQQLQQQAGAQRGDTLGERAAGVERADRRRDRAEDGARVQLPDDQHDRGAGLLVARQDRGGHRRGAAVARQQRGVDVEDAARQRLDEVAGEDVRRSGEDADVRLEGCDLGRVVTADLLRREHRDARLQRRTLDLGRDRLPGAPARPVGLRDGGDDLDVGRLEEPA